MARHDIRMDQSIRDLGKVDMVLEVVIDDFKRGELHVSMGGVDWWPPYARKMKHTWTWSQLADVLETGRTRRV
jgi:hypothetical protein